METSGAEGGPLRDFEKPMDKPRDQYTANETVPKLGDAGLVGTSDIPSQENSGSLAKKFS